MPQPALCPLRAALLVGVCAAGILGGCDVTIQDGDIKGVSLRARATQEWSRRYPLADDGRVEIINTNGPVEAVAGPPGTVDIDAVLVARAMTDARAKEILSEITLDESASPGHVRVATVRSGRGRGVDITFKVTLPPNAGLEMTSSNGTLKAAGLGGHVKAMIVNGAVELEAMSGTIDAAAVNGAVSARMTQVAGPLRFESTNGRIAIEIPKTAKTTLNARSVNGGGPEIDLRVTNGRITITGVDVPDAPVSR